MLRSVLAVAAGFAVTVLLVLVTTAVTGLAFGLPMTTSPGAPVTTPGVGYLAVNLLFAIVSALAGGWTTARLSVAHPMLHALVLAAIIFALGIMGARTPQPGQPHWYPWTLALIGPVGILVGAGLVRRRAAQAPGEPTGQAP